MGKRPIGGELSRWSGLGPGGRNSVDGAGLHELDSRAIVIEQVELTAAIDAGAHFEGARVARAGGEFRFGFFNIGDK
jgi:hypothetical protein